jgi:type II secretory pathway component GspD/PulD (secretin)
MRFYFFVAITCGSLLSISSLSAQQNSPELKAESNTGNSSAPPSTYPANRTVHLNFREQEWLPVLKWLASELRLNLDWQTLPDGMVNLHSEKAFEVDEAEDLINMQLLARGFTLLKRDEVLRIVPLKEIDVTLVPYIEPEKLETSRPHQFARVSFSLEWMIAEDAAKEFQPLLSPYGHLFALSSSNRLEAMDAVINLREVHRLLTRAEKDEVRRERVAEFRLKYRKAEEVVVKVRQLVGLPADNTPNSVQTQLDIEQAKFKAEAVKQMGGGAKELIADKKPTIFVSVNEKENSILVNAPPNKVEVIRQAIEAIDKPLPDSVSTWETMSRVKVHEVSGFDPDTITRLLASLQEQGNIAKGSRIQYESAYHRLIVFASPEDQLTIAQVIESFRAQRREPSVLPLANIDPVYAVKAIQLILKNPERGATLPASSTEGKFQIEADPDHHRLLLWATQDELKQVKDFLQRLGESQTPSMSDAKIRVVSLNGQSITGISNKLEEMWRTVSDVPLIIQPQPTDSDKPASPLPLAPNAKSDQATSAPAKSNDVSVKSNDVTTASYVSTPLAEPIADKWKEIQDEGSLSEPPLRIVEGENGEAIILSRNPVAVESAKLLIEQLTRSTSNVQVITLKHAQALFVKQQLETMLQTAVATTVASKLATPTPLLKIDADARTNRLLIQNASASQMERIKDLVPVIDQPTSADQPMVRKVATYRFKYRNAIDVVDVVKDVFRDLLSINDRAFTSNSTRPVGYNRNLAATVSNPEYQGLLAVGVDRNANILVVSAPAYLIEEVLDLVKSIDTPSDGNAMTIVPFEMSQGKSKQTDAILKILTDRKK